MHLALLAAVVLAQVPLPVPYPGGAQDDYQSPIVGLVAWDKGGSDSWGAGIPTPTIDCAAVGTSSVASLQCSGATPSFAGTGQTAAGSPWWYRNDTAVRPSIVLNGSTDYWTLGDVGDATGSFAASAAFRADTLTGDQIIVAKDVGGGRQFLLYRSASVLAAVVCKTGGTCSTHTIGTLVAGAAYSAAFAYVFVADGTSVIRSNLNGVAPGELATAVGPPVNVSTPLRIGAYGDGTLKWAGSIRRVALWTGADAPTSAAQLAQLVATQWGLAHDRPAGTVATHSRTDSTYCGPFSDAEQYLLGPGAPCTHAPTYSGWASGGQVAGGIEVYGIGVNGTSYSEDLSTWTAYNSGSTNPTVTVNATTAPDGTLTADEVAFGVADDSPVKYSILSKTEGYYGDASAYCQTIWAKGKTEAGTLRFGLTTTGTNGIGTCSVGTTWTRCQVCQTLTAATRYFQIGPHSVDAPAWTVYLWGAQTTKTATPQPYRATPGATAYAGSASTATTVTVPVALLSKDRFALGISATATGNWATVNTGLLQWGGSYGAANTVSVYTDASAKIAVEVYDGAAGWRRWTADAALSGTGQKRIGVAFSAGLIRVLVDDVEVSGTMSGAGTGLLGALPTASVVVGTSGSSILRGLDAKVCQANDVAGLKRCLR